jgi:hypothetical protein
MRGEVGCCLGRRIGWNQEECFAFGDLAGQEAYNHKKKVPKDWIGPEKLREYGFDKNFEVAHNLSST